MLYQQQQIAIARPRKIQAKWVLAFGIIQILIGILVSAVRTANDIALMRISFGFGLWTGMWILIGGIICVISYKHPTNKTLNCMNMVFAIVSSCMSFLYMVEMSAVIHYFNKYHKSCPFSQLSPLYGYRDCDKTTSTSGIAVNVIILLLMLAEWAISISTAILCCRFGCAAGCIEDNSNTYSYQQVYQQAPPNVLPQQPPQAQTAVMLEQQQQQMQLLPQQ